MSTWRYAVKALHKIGGKGPRAAFDDGLVGDHQLTRAAQLGLIVSDRCHGMDHFTVGEKSYPMRTFALFELTRKGVEYAEGRIVDVAAARGRSGSGMGTTHFIATWIAALPRGVRIGGDTESC